MYIRTREGLGQGQTTWPTLQTFHRPTAQPVPSGYLGNFSEHLGKDDEESCKPRFIVAYFNRRSDKTNPVIKKDISDIATNIIRRLEGKLRPLQVKKDVGLYLHHEGHVDKATDPTNFGKLDWDRATTVGDVLSNLISDRWKAAQFGSLLINNTYSAAGASRPISGVPRKNRRVEVCIRKITIKPYVSP